MTYQLNQKTGEIQNNMKKLIKNLIRWAYRKYVAETYIIRIEKPSFTGSIWLHKTEDGKSSYVDINPPWGVTEYGANINNPKCSRIYFGTDYKSTISEKDWYNAKYNC